MRRELFLTLTRLVVVSYKFLSVMCMGERSLVSHYKVLGISILGKFWNVWDF